MAVVNGSGGYLTVFFDGDIDPPPATRRYHVGRWSLDDRSQVVDVSNASAFGTRYAHVQNDVSWMCEVPLDDTLYPEVAGLRRGDIAYIYFKIGSNDTFHYLEQTTITAVAYECSSMGDVVRLSITGAGGALNRNENNSSPPSSETPSGPYDAILGPPPGYGMSPVVPTIPPMSSNL